jgi:uncharacterized damage-inducible protein DinB
MMISDSRVPLCGYTIRMRMIAAALLLVSALPAYTQDVKGTFLKHLKISKDFTLKVAEAMPEDSYDFKLTPPQMSFGGQITHLAQAQDFFLCWLSGEKPREAKPASKSKADIIAFTKTAFDKAIARVEGMKAKDLAETFNTSEGPMTGLELLMGDLDHTTHHRASAEMYLRAKGITPPEYKF